MQVRSNSINKSIFMLKRSHCDGRTCPTMGQVWPHQAHWGVGDVGGASSTWGDSFRKKKN